MSVQSQVALGLQVAVKFSRIMDNDYLLLCPAGCKWRFTKGEAMVQNGSVETVSFNIVIAVNAIQWRIEPCQEVKCFRLRNVACMHNALDTRCIKQIDNFSDIFKVVVGVADNAYTHGGPQ